jgi:hypothetical protein
LANAFVLTVDSSTGTHIRSDFPNIRSDVRLRYVLLPVLRLDFVGEFCDEVENVDEPLPQNPDKVVF